MFKKIVVAVLLFFGSSFLFSHQTDAESFKEAANYFEGPCQVSSSNPDHLVGKLLRYINGRRQEGTTLLVNIDLNNPPEGVGVSVMPWSGKYYACVFGGSLPVHYFASSGTR